MPRAILLTQCLQNDFIAPIGPTDRLPCDLHIGWSEARRLVGERPTSGPLLDFMAACHEEVRRGNLAIIHLCDWHDQRDPLQKDELEFYGLHCLKDTPGAALLDGLEEQAWDVPNVHVIRSIAINDFEDTELPGLLRRLSADTPRDEVRIGVIGVWTDVKVHYLIYDLKTRGHYRNLAVCSALTASRSRQDHFRALDTLRGSLRVGVIDSTAAFQEWLGVARSSIYGDLKAPDSPLPALAAPGGGEPELDMEERRIVKNLFAHCRQVELRPLAGGFSGSRVFMTASQDKDGYQEVPFVVKVGARAAIAQERARFEQVENLLGNHAPQVKSWVELEERAGLKYMYATMGRDAGTFKRFFEGLGGGQADLDRLAATLEEIRDTVLLKLYRNAVPERLQLFDHYLFRPQYAANALGRIEGLLGELPAGDTFALPGVPERLPSPVPFYQAAFAPQLAAPPREVMVSWVHGDLNTANLLLDGRGNFWMIDFFHTARSHVLKDIAKLENDLKFILTPLAGPDDLARALRAERLLARQRDFREPLPALPPDLDADPAWRKTWLALSLLRSFAGTLCGDLTDTDQYWPALLRYSAHNLAFEESDQWQKLYALGSTALLCERISAAALVV